MHYLFSLRALLLTLVAAGSALTAALMLSEEFPAAMYMSPVVGSIEQGMTQQFSVIVSSDVPVNAFTGEIVFDTEKFNVVAIDYNTAVADLWVAEPWYNRAANSIYFAGGTTQSGGFVGTEALVTVTLRAVRTGDAMFSLRNPRMLAHDGLGSDVPLRTPLDALFTVDTTPYAVPLSAPVDTHVVVFEDVPPLDINQDGVVGFQDVGVLLSVMGSDDPQYDFTGDGVVTWSDIRRWQELRKQEL